MTIALATNADSASWNEYVRSHPDASFYHVYEWKRIIEQVFNHTTFYLISKSVSGSVDGILPLVMMKSALFGNFMVSLPYLNYGGILADDDDTGKKLLAEAVTITQAQRLSHIELRHREDKPINLPAKTAKVSLLLDLPGSADALLQSFKSKLRSQVRKPEKEGLTGIIGGMEQADNFYYVFSRNMRYLGTPVYDRSLFKTILSAFPRETRICAVFKEEKPVAAGFLVSYKDTVEMPWASSLREYNHLSPNMMLYWKVLSYAADNGFKKFDFGRSTPHEGTYQFKMQWGAQPIQLYWHYWLSQGDALPEINPHNPKYRLFINIWQHLPLWLTNALGPKIVRNIP
jgi:FemAB-related protein (PEP-CTERM system-associated)